MNTHLSHRIPILLMLSVFLLVLSCKYFNKNPSAEQIVERYIEICGGRKRIDSVHSASLSGILTVSGGVNMRYYCFIENPGKSAFIIKQWDDSEYKTIYNQGKATEINAGERTIVTDKSRLRRMELSARNFVELGYKILGYKLSFVNTENYNGKECYRIKIVSPEGDTDFKLYEKESGLLVMTAAADGTRTTFGNYENFERFLFPTDLEVIYKTGKKVNLHLTSAKLNQRINPKIFQFQ